MWKKVLKNEKCKEVGDNWQFIQFLVFTVMILYF